MIEVGQYELQILITNLSPGLVITSLHSQRRPFCAHIHFKIRMNDH